MVQYLWDEVDAKQKLETGEPPAKKFCKQLSDAAPLQQVKFTGTNANEGKAKCVKRTAPQDDLSAKIFPQYFTFGHKI